MHSPLRAQQRKSSEELRILRLFLLLKRFLFSFEFARKLTTEERAFYNAWTTPREHFDYMNTLGRFRASVSGPRRERVNVLRIYVRLNLENGLQPQVARIMILSKQTERRARAENPIPKKRFIMYFLLAPVCLRSQNSQGRLLSYLCKERYSSRYHGLRTGRSAFRGWMIF